MLFVESSSHPLEKLYDTVLGDNLLTAIKTGQICDMVHENQDVIIVKSGGTDATDICYQLPDRSISIQHDFTVQVGYLYVHK